MREIGKVIDSNDNVAKVRVTKHSACSKCDRECPLSNTDQHEQEEMIFKVKDKIGANKGDKVSIELENRNLVFSSLLMYLMPIINMIIGYFFGKWFGMKYKILDFELAGVLGTLLFLGLSYFFLKYINSKLENNNKINPRLVKIHNERSYYNRRQ